MHALNSAWKNFYKVEISHYFRNLGQLMIFFFRIALFVGLALTFFLSVVPQPPMIPDQLSDKAQHALAFVTFTLLALGAYPRASSWKIFLWLGLVGVAIEGVQSLPGIERDPSAADVLVDFLAAGGTLLLISSLRRLKLVGTEKSRRESAREGLRNPD
ncbi:hypothetical protein P7228_06480 [Altererythrobacter arenosus]|uniref:VanZ-like domain-containing protein n=1 Tax=Altererythrobacter arenosus TaxID=3032592 RepID=A0ABY8FUL7_9SPHN|nr:hypothetical protein [Altererythrobacter sp. CAU 1644]WFL78704.1 hypothetical protein P7228_06480 [Altererythrobacter sp. CAU 1644]